MKTKHINNPQTLIPTALLILSASLFSTNSNAAIWDTINSTVNGINSKVNTIKSNVDTIKSNSVKTLNDTASTALAINDARKEITGDIVSQVNEGVVFIKNRINDQKVELGDFLGSDGQCSISSECDQFRQDLKRFLTHIENIGNILIEFGGNPQPLININLEKLGNHIDTIPGHFLFPLYTTTKHSINIFNADFDNMLTDATSNLLILEQAYSGECTAIMDDIGPDNFELTAFYTKRTAQAVSVTAQIVEALSEELGQEVKIGIHGYVGLHFQINIVKTIGKALGLIGSSLKDISADAANNLEKCQSRKLAADRHNEILAAISNLPGSNSGNANSGIGGSIDSALDGGGALNIPVLMLILIIGGFRVFMKK